MIDWTRISVPKSLYSVGSALPTTLPADNPIGKMMHTNRRVLRSKLETISSAVRERLKIRKDNIERIADDREALANMIQGISVASNYHLREHREKGPLYQKTFELAKERRAQDTECWRDVVLVLRDFLTFWDEYERAKARGEFLENV
ncbi:MAG: hypothetical protein K1Y02_06190 [Candidatus Hydrogenedentes bacterium]|nr:hypothetical protein [Candidatus Hydrogenedentota bacterium]